MLNSLETKRRGTSELGISLDLGPDVIGLETLGSARKPLKAGGLGMPSLLVKMDQMENPGRSIYNGYR
jgi:hypothetical protein